MSSKAMSPATVRDGLYEQFARIGQAISSPKRLRLLNLLCQGEKSVDKLAQQSQQSVAATSAHLKVLREAHLVATRKEGRRVYYSVAGPEVINFWLGLRGVGKEQLPEVREVVRGYFEDRDTMTRIDGDALVAQVERGNVVLLDLRPADEYREGHLPGARSIPFNELEQRLEELPGDRQIVAYCRGPYCVMAVEMVSWLRAHGFDAHRLEHGVVEWRHAGHDVAVGS